MDIELAKITNNGNEKLYWAVLAIGIFLPYLKLGHRAPNRINPIHLISKFSKASFFAHILFINIILFPINYFKLTNFK